MRLTAESEIRKLGKFAWYSSLGVNLHALHPRATLPVPALDGKAKAGMVLSVSGRTRGVQIKLRSLENAFHT